MHRRLIVASQKDTIKNTAILSFLNQNSLRYFGIRKTTQEEDTVLKYKKNNQYYNSESIKWDHERIVFPFIKPKLQKK